MPRKSAASKMVSVTGQPAPLEPRKGLAPPLRKLFAQIVAEVQARHFVPSDRALLERYCEAIALAETAQAHIEREGAVTEEGRISPWVTVQEKAHRSAVALSGKLRLCPSARLDRKVAGTTTAAPARSMPWED